jgi:hypothetical protein
VQRRGLRLPSDVLTVGEELRRRLGGQGDEQKISLGARQLDPGEMGNASRRS